MVFPNRLTMYATLTAAVLLVGPGAALPLLPTLPTDPAGAAPPILPSAPDIPIQVGGLPLDSAAVGRLQKEIQGHPLLGALPSAEDPLQVLDTIRDVQDDLCAATEQVLRDYHEVRIIRGLLLARLERTIPGGLPPGVAETVSTECLPTLCANVAPGTVNGVRKDFPILPRPDLTVRMGQPSYGFGTASIPVWVSNVGDVDAEAFEVDVSYYGFDGVRSGSQTYDVECLPRGETIRLGISAGPLTATQYVATAQVDRPRDITEADEDNNAAAIYFAFLGGDLAIPQMEAQACLDGIGVCFRATISNSGDQDAGFWVSWTIHNPVNATVASGSTQVSVPAQGSILFALPRAHGSDLEATLAIDVAQQWLEDDETNNWRGAGWIGGNPTTTTAPPPSSWSTPTPVSTTGTPTISMSPSPSWPSPTSASPTHTSQPTATIVPT